MNGEPCIRGRVGADGRGVVEAVAVFPNRDDLSGTVPTEPDDVRQALAFAAADLEDSAAEGNAA